MWCGQKLRALKATEQTSSPNLISNNASEPTIIALATSSLDTSLSVHPNAAMRTLKSSWKDVVKAEHDIYSRWEKLAPKLFSNGRVLLSFASQGTDGDQIKNISSWRAGRNDLIEWESQETPRLVRRFIMTEILHQSNVFESIHSTVSINLAYMLCWIARYVTRLCFIHDKYVYAAKIYFSGKYPCTPTVDWLNQRSICYIKSHRVTGWTCMVIAHWESMQCTSWSSLFDSRPWFTDSDGKIEYLRKWWVDNYHKASDLRRFKKLETFTYSCARHVQCHVLFI